MAKFKEFKPSGDAPDSISGKPFYTFKLDEGQRNFVDAIWDKENLIVLCNSVAGTGKSLLSVGTANLMYQYGRYDGIVCVTFPCSEQKQGFLPGDISSKSEVYFEPIYQAMIKCGINPMTSVNTSSLVNQKNGDGFITLLTSTYLRGTNFENKVVIIDEAQNGTVEELKKVLTRCSDTCKVIVTGHTGQIDLVNTSKSGFAKYIEHFSGQKRASICTLTENHRGWISSFADKLQ